MGEHSAKLLFYTDCQTGGSSSVSSGRSHRLNQNLPRGIILLSNGLKLSLKSLCHLNVAIIGTVILWDKFHKRKKEILTFETVTLYLMTWPQSTQELSNIDAKRPWWPLSAAHSIALPHNFCRLDKDRIKTSYTFSQGRFFFPVVDDNNFQNEWLWQ